MSRGETPRVPNGQLHIVDDVPAAFADLVAEEVSLARSAEPADDPFRLVLSGGATARLCYEQLAARQGVDWGRVECLVGDERCVSPDDPDANQRMIRESLVDQADPRPRFVPMDCEAGPAAYEEVIASSPLLDLVHLGLGPDGHTASLFPGSAALEAPPGRLVERNVDPSGRNPHPRLTLTFAGIARGRLVVFTVAGADKAEALRRITQGEDLPAGRVRADRVVWLCDPAAAGDGAVARVSR